MEMMKQDLWIFCCTITAHWCLTNNVSQYWSYLDVGILTIFLLNLPLPSSKSTFSQPSKERMYKGGNEN